MDRWIRQRQARDFASQAFRSHLSPVTFCQVFQLDEEVS